MPVVQNGTVRVNESFLATVTVNVLVASPPVAGCPTTLTVYSPGAASSPAVRVNLASVPPLLMTGPAGSMVTPLGTSANARVTSWSKFVPRLIPTVPGSASPCLRDTPAAVRLNVLSAWPYSGGLTQGSVAPGPPALPRRSQPAAARDAITRP